MYLAITTYWNDWDDDEVIGYEVTKCTTLEEAMRVQEDNESGDSHTSIYKAEQIC